MRAADMLSTIPSRGGTAITGAGAPDTRASIRVNTAPAADRNDRPTKICNSAFVAELERHFEGIMISLHAQGACAWGAPVRGQQRIDLCELASGDDVVSTYHAKKHFIGCHTKPRPATLLGSAYRHDHLWRGGERVWLTPNVFIDCGVEHSRPCCHLFKATKLSQPCDTSIGTVVDGDPYRSKLQRVSPCDRAQAIPSDKQRGCKIAAPAGTALGRSNHDHDHLSAADNIGDASTATGETSLRQTRPDIID
jgi:hypothetical protein